MLHIAQKEIKIEASLLVPSLKTGNDNSLISASFSVVREPFKIYSLIMQRAMLIVFILQDGRRIQEMRVETWHLLQFHKGKI